MNTLKTYSNIGLRFAILSVLGMALMIVAKPQSAMAITPCQQSCLQAFQFCNSTCPGVSPSISACTSACATKYASCRASCN
jgi:hypothetical protein